MEWVSWTGAPEDRTFSEELARRFSWLSRHLTFRKLLNLTIAGAQYIAHSERLASCPAALKIDISPLCNLRCTICVHADPNGNPALEKQRFDATQMMSMDDYRRIIDEISGQAVVVSLDYLGDPLVHPELWRMCRAASDAGLNVHICTNFSFPLSDDRIAEIVESGLTHITVSVDGLDQRAYGLTRVGGRVDAVISNLTRLCQLRAKRAQSSPEVEVQYIRFQHNLDDLERAKHVFPAMGVDRLTTFWGSLHNYTDIDPGTYAVHRPWPRQFLPRCFWPYFGMVVKYNGDVIPCCNHRLGTQYTNCDDARALGNVFRTSVRDVWNSPAYRAVRRLVGNPRNIEREPTLEDCFCYGCPGVFDTDRDRNLRPAEQYAFGELYTVTGDGHPKRISGPRSEIRRDTAVRESHGAQHRRRLLLREPHLPHAKK
ncbi:MAG: SPASM domain-containing protein [Candidatus Eisenbacteria bacterium]|nr:SPASM domain-containing protein [Candidatus Eisenbacteria bacterium]